MKIVVPMTGMGRRFLEAGYTDPKPLVPIDGTPMIEHVMKMFPSETDVLFICNTRHLETTRLRTVLEHISPTAKIVSIDKKNWDGPVPDILACEKYIPDGEPVMVCYCDFTVVWDYENFLHTVQGKSFDGAIVAYRGFHPHHLGPTYYGYMRVDKNNMLLEIKEKECFTDNRMNEYAAAGSYYFRTGALLKKYFAEAVSKGLRTGKEFYASLPYNLMARDGLKIYAYEVQQFIQFGTPDDVKSYEYWLRYFRDSKKI